MIKVNLCLTYFISRDQKMLKKITATFALTATIALSSEASHSAAPSMMVGANISTLGVGGVAGYQFNKTFAVRGVLNYFSHKRTFSDNASQVKGNLRMFTAGLLGDIHPFQNMFRITGGLLYNGNRIGATFTNTQNITVNGTTYTPAQIGQATGELTFRKIAPYVGIGLDTGNGAKGLSFTADAGFVFQGRAKGKITKLTGLLAGGQQAMNDVAIYTANEVNKNKMIKCYPVISVGFVYRF